MSRSAKLKLYWTRVREEQRKDPHAPKHRIRFVVKQLMNNERQGRIYGT